MLYSSKEQNTQIICDLVSIPSGGEITPSFVALSYVAVDNTPTKTIRLDGSDFLVTEILESALRNLRLLEEDLYLWIDPICTGGSYPGDPRVVMKENADIHNAAREIIVWLGGDTLRSQLAFSAVKLLLALSQSQSPVAMSKTLDEHLRTPFFANTLSSSQPLFNLPWWHWGRIEALIQTGLFPKVSFFCGTNRMDWNSFSSFVCTLRFALPRLRSDYPSSIDQILLQIPGKIPENFREVFYAAFAGNPADNQKPVWGYGTLFAHPQDVLYWLSETSEDCKAGRVLTSLSSRLCNRYRKRCF